MVQHTVQSMVQHMLTTVDNPYDPSTNFDEWYAYDEAAGYHTSSFLARIVRTSDELSEADQVLAIEQAIDEILEENVLGLYRKVVMSSQVSHSMSNSKQLVSER